MPRPAPALRAAVPAVLLALALTGCSGDDTGSSTGAARPAAVETYTAEVPVLLPGAPGEEAEVVQPGESGEIPNPGAFGDVEVEFVTGMVPHHAQALEMASLAPERASDPRVKALAERIAADQGPEIAAMQAWLSQNGLPAADAGGHGGHGGHGGMPGMASEADMARLVAARGPAFDRLFLELMTRHHEGAIAMADDAATASNVVVAEMVADTGAKQSVEIARMQELLADLPA